MTRYDPLRHHRRSIRLKGYDYAQPGAYFITLCTHERACLFGEVTDGHLRLNDYGRVVAETWEWLAEQYRYVELDEWVVMPNHMHGILVIVGDASSPNGNAAGPRRGGSRPAPTDAGPQPTPMDGEPQPAPTDAGPQPTPPDAESQPAPAEGQPKRKPLGQLIGAFKTVSAKRINALRGTPAAPVWQRNYYEHVVRNERELRAIRRYIANNPLKWTLDRDNPAQDRSAANTEDDYWREAGL
jgi:REP element-mobilizing transposase RayT